ncbi:MAG: PhoU domain-containing protein [Candidatus Poribacteria bacterium]
MLKEILNILRREDLLTQTMKEVGEMLAISELMFRSAIDTIVECKESNIDIYEKDREIDKCEWDVRRKVMEHLILSDKKSDVSVALFLTDAVRDIERIGDYSKNIFELTKVCLKKVIVNEAHAKFFDEIESQILEMFAFTQSAYNEGDVKKAELVLELRLQASKKCDEFLNYLASEEELPTEYTIIYALLSGYLKRIIAHLKNIASMIINPFRRMEIREEENKK